MRGKGNIFGQVFQLLRITPAYAGKRAVSGISLAVSWDHPRLCGEKARLAGGGDKLWGSPPPMRGKVGNTKIPQKILRITPAYAGKSREKQKFRVFFWGSPPPMRGKVLVHFV